VPLPEMAHRAPRITFSRLRGEIVELPRGAILINDSYNANPVSMRAAARSPRLAERSPASGSPCWAKMRELGDDAEAYHREVGEHARAAARSW